MRDTVLAIERCGRFAGWLVQSVREGRESRIQADRPPTNTPERIMLTVIFDLTMPNNNSWNGRWSGESDRHCITRRLKDAQAEELHGKDFYYNFGDGWGANVHCKISSGSVETRKANRQSKGFCGYDWMVDQVLKHGEILPRNKQAS